MNTCASLAVSCLYRSCTAHYAWTAVQKHFDHNKDGILSLVCTHTHICWRKLQSTHATILKVVNVSHTYTYTHPNAHTCMISSRCIINLQTRCNTCIWRQKAAFGAYIVTDTQSFLIFEQVFLEVKYELFCIHIVLGLHLCIHLARNIKISEWLSTLACRLS